MKFEKLDCVHCVFTLLNLLLNFEKSFHEIWVHCWFYLQAITFLQSAHRLKASEEIFPGEILEMAGVSLLLVIGLQTIGMN